MTEILTESFCERCGTRYTFEAAIPKKRRIGKLKVLSKGLRNYVLSEDASLDEALAEARSEEEREVSGGQLDAFHQAFQFCMSCRQYTCANCWNDAEGRCLSCAPLSVDGGQLRSPLDDLLAGGGGTRLASSGPLDDALAAAASARNGHAPIEEPADEFQAPPVSLDQPTVLVDAPPEIVGSAWPTIDLFRTPDAAVRVDLPAESLNEAETPSVATGLPSAETERSQAAAAPEAAEPAEAIQSDGSATDFWARPFTGYAPVREPTNGHDPAAAEIVTPPAEPLPEPLAELLAKEPQVASAVGAAAPAPEVDARAVELAERTTRLLGRFRVQPRSAGSAPVTPVVDESPVPTAAQELSVAPTQPTIESRLEPSAQPAWMFVQPPAPEPERPAVEPEPQPEPEPAIAAQPEPEPAIAAAAAPDEPRPPIVEARPLLTPAAIDRIEMPAWPTPVRPRLSDSAAIPPAIPAFPPAPVPSPSANPVAPQWPAPLRPDLDASSTPFWASGGSGIDPGADVWRASAREVAGVPGQTVSAVGVQSCVSCGLSLSATARFCRRCGSRQG